MEAKLDRDQLVALVKKIMYSEGTEEEIDAWQDLLERNVPDPRVSDLIFYPGREMSPEEVVDIALSYRPIST